MLTYALLPLSDLHFRLSTPLSLSPLSHSIPFCQLSLPPFPARSLCHFLFLSAHTLTLSVCLFFRQLSVFSLYSYVCLIGPFNYVSLHESLLQF